MSFSKTTRTIKASAQSVFEAIAHIENFSKVVPDIIQVKFLSEKKTGLGARFKETRKMGKREATTELEITEYVPNERVRFVSDAGGSVWDTIMTVQPKGDGQVELAMQMDAKPHKFVAKLLNPLIKGMVNKAVNSDMDAVKAYCEQ